MEIKTQNQKLNKSYAYRLEVRARGLGFYRVLISLAESGLFDQSTTLPLCRVVFCINGVSETVQCRQRYHAPPHTHTHTHTHTTTTAVGRNMWGFSLWNVCERIVWQHYKMQETRELDIPSSEAFSRNRPDHTPLINEVGCSGKCSTVLRPHQVSGNLSNLLGISARFEKEGTRQYQVQMWFVVSVKHSALIMLVQFGESLNPLTQQNSAGLESMKFSSLEFLSRSAQSSLATRTGSSSASVTSCCLPSSLHSSVSCWLMVIRK